MNPTWESKRRVQSGMRRSIGFWIVISLLGGIHVVRGGEQPRFNIGVEYGTWKPIEISAEQALAPRVVPGTRALVGIAVGSFVREDVEIVVSLEHWEHFRLPEWSAASRVRVVPLSLSFRHRLSEAGWLTPFADYGVLAMLGFDRTRTTGEWNRDSGFGATLGAGIEAVVGRVAILFRAGYVYAKFSRRLGQTKNYSGPQLSVAGCMRF